MKWLSSPLKLRMKGLHYKMIKNVLCCIGMPLTKAGTLYNKLPYGKCKIAYIRDVLHKPAYSTAFKVMQGFGVNLWIMIWNYDLFD